MSAQTGRPVVRSISRISPDCALVRVAREEDGLPVRGDRDGLPPPPEVPPVGPGPAPVLLPLPHVQPGLDPLRARRRLADEGHNAAGEEEPVAEVGEVQRRSDRVRQRDRPGLPGAGLEGPGLGLVEQQEPAVRKGGETGPLIGHADGLRPRLLPGPDVPAPQLTRVVDAHPAGQVPPVRGEHWAQDHREHLRRGLEPEHLGRRPGVEVDPGQHHRLGPVGRVVLIPDEDRGPPGRADHRGHAGRDHEVGTAEPADEGPTIDVPEFPDALGVLPAGLADDDRPDAVREEIARTGVLDRQRVGGGHEPGPGVEDGYVPAPADDFDRPAVGGELEGLADDPVADRAEPLDGPGRERVAVQIGRRPGPRGGGQEQHAEDTEWGHDRPRRRGDRGMIPSPRRPSGGYGWRSRTMAKR